MLAELVGRGVSGPWENIGRLVQTREDLAVMAEVILGDQLRDPGDHGVASCGHMSFKMTTSPHPAEPRHLLHCSVALALREGRLVHVFVGFSLLRMTHESQQLSHLRGDAGSCSGAQSRLTLCDPMDCSPPGSSVRGILQARTLEWVAISFSTQYPYMCSVTCLDVAVQMFFFKAVIHI